MKKRIGKFFIILGVIFFCVTPFYSVKAEDNYHNYVYNIYVDGQQHGTGSFTYYEVDDSTYQYRYVIDLTINLDGRYNGGIGVSIRNTPNTKILVENATIYGATNSGISLWISGQNYVHVRFFSYDPPGYSYTVLDVFNESLSRIDYSEASSDHLICDYLQTNEDNMETLQSKFQDLLNLFGNTSQATPNDLMSMIASIRDDIDQIEYFDNSIYSYLIDNLDPMLLAFNTALSNIDSNTANIYDVLLDIAQNQDLSSLESVLDDLRSAINSLAGNINITNNVNVNSHDLPFYQYMFISVLVGQGNQYQLVHFNDAGQPYLLWGEIKNRTFTFNPGTGNNDIVFAYLCSNSNVILSIDNNQNLTRLRGIGAGNAYSNYYRENYSFGNHTLQFYLSSGDPIADSVRIYPIYYGRSDSVPADVASIFNLSSVSTPYQSTLDQIVDLLENQEGFDDSDILAAIDDVVSAINNLSLNISINNSDVTNLVTNFNADIDMVHNIDVNFKNSFDTYKQRFNQINRLDDTSWFSPVLFNHIFNNLWANSSVSWVLILILFCALLIAMLGLRR